MLRCESIHRIAELAFHREILLLIADPLQFCLAQADQGSSDPLPE